MALAASRVQYQNGREEEKEQTGRRRRRRDATDAAAAATNATDDAADDTDDAVSQELTDCKITLLMCYFARQLGTTVAVSTI
jgi:hypothetical protein